MAIFGLKQPYEITIKNRSQKLQIENAFHHFLLLYGIKLVDPLIYTILLSPNFVEWQNCWQN